MELTKDEMAFLNQCAPIVKRLTEEDGLTILDATEKAMRLILNRQRELAHGTSEEARIFREALTGSVYHAIRHRAGIEKTVQDIADRRSAEGLTEARILMEHGHGYEIQHTDATKGPRYSL